MRSIVGICGKNVGGPSAQTIIDSHRVLLKTRKSYETHHKAYFNQ